MKLPERTIERLSTYRRTLLNCLDAGKNYIYSHELANLHSITAVQVRRDLMLIGFSSQTKKGYDVKELIDVIGKILDSSSALNVAVLGMGNLGRAVTTYFNGKRSKLKIAATFDVDSNKVDRVISGVNCYHIRDFKTIVQRENITIAIITSPPDTAKQLAEILEGAGIRGVLNFTTIPINISSNVYLEEFDMITSIEKVAYFVKEMNGGSLEK
ncbi:redox-sensing transcriptional repressor Rex [Williamwhitmania taraxaci]|uniref:Redox-sensing transcriptional repressor Rex n=1 Tax=Williamwhitmania taraxaci TaxID=1640674 RepID=A0A1G6NSA6_9BACT|nr:redox-sensing transcriptional repressor Rex [Williamwhitmania taraxaci]SDC70793.1 redox-sensing transcriptional repressor [Williamwhitmania taraxaci]